MSSSEVEPAKLLLPYLQRADELQKHDPLVAYYCRLFAMERGLKIPPKERTKMTNSLLVSLMNQLEKDKKSVKLSPDDNLHIEGFALNLFAKADKQDRAGRADLSTAKTFYAASIFFEILYQFGEIQPDLEQKQKYAVWKAADIRKALKEGRKPNPGPPIGDDELGLSSGVPSSGGDYGQVESLSRSQSMQQGSTSSFQDHYQPPPALQKQTSFPPTNSSSSSDYSSNDYSQSRYQHPPPNMSRTSSYQQPYEPPPPPPEEQNRAPPIQPGYVGQDMANPYSYPSFQYPSPAESFPTAAAGSYMNPTALSGTYSSYYQSSESGLTNGGYAQQPTPSVPEPVTQQYSSSQSGTYGAKPSKGDYVHDPNYQPSPEKIAEAHKAARFAVGALAFDDVSVAVEYLRSSLELLTNPSASAHSHSS